MDIQYFHKKLHLFARKGALQAHSFGDHILILSCQQVQHDSTITVDSNLTHVSWLQKKAIAGPGIAATYWSKCHHVILFLDPSSCFLGPLQQCARSWELLIHSCTIWCKTRTVIWNLAQTEVRPETYYVHGTVHGFILKRILLMTVLFFETCTCERNRTPKSLFAGLEIQLTPSTSQIGTFGRMEMKFTWFVGRLWIRRSFNWTSCHHCFWNMLVKQSYFFCSCTALCRSCVISESIKGWPTERRLSKAVGNHSMARWHSLIQEVITALTDFKLAKFDSDKDFWPWKFLHLVWRNPAFDNDGDWCACSLLLPHGHMWRRDLTSRMVPLKSRRCLYFVLWCLL